MENQQSISSDLIRGHIDTIILHTLIENDKFAQQISDAIELKSNDEYKINQATLYSSLKRLESLKLVSSYWHDYEGGRRKFFRITDNGKKTVENNLSSWVYSRSIIDRLIDIAPYKVIPAINTIDRNMNQNAETVLPVKPENHETISDNIKEIMSDITPKETTKTVTEKPMDIYDEHERNFRSIIDGLIRLSADSPHEQREVVNLEPIGEISGENAKPDIQKFNETIDETDYNANRSNFNGKIDYGDLTLKAEKEGYNIRISSKDSAMPVGKVFINKLNFAVSAIIFLIALIEIGVLYATLTSAFDSAAVVVLSSLSVIPVIIFGILYFINREKLSGSKISADGILISAIVAFNLLLINFAFDFLLEIDLADTSTLLAALVIPVIYYADAVLFFLFRFILSPRKTFLINKA